MEKVTTLYDSLQHDFLINNPRIAVLALNPHAGDENLLGMEETDKIIPAIEELRDNGIQCFGPYPADGFFGSGAYHKFDGILAMYHDQGLAPFKALAMEGGVNYTAGLPIVRTSPDHGTAYDKAGIGKASPDSFRQALYLACDIYANRQRYAEISKNPLKKQKEDRGRRNDRNVVEKDVDEMTDMNALD